MNNKILHQCSTCLSFAILLISGCSSYIPLKDSRQDTIILDVNTRVNEVDFDIWFNENIDTGNTLDSSELVVSGRVRVISENGDSVDPDNSMAGFSKPTMPWFVSDAKISLMRRDADEPAEVEHAFIDDGGEFTIRLSDPFSGDGNRQSYVLSVEKPDEWWGTTLRYPQIEVETTIEILGNFHVGDDAADPEEYLRIDYTDFVRVSNGTGTCINATRFPSVETLVPYCNDGDLYLKDIRQTTFEFDANTESHVIGFNTWHESAAPVIARLHIEGTVMVTEDSLQADGSADEGISEDDSGLSGLELPPWISDVKISLIRTDANEPDEVRMIYLEESGGFFYFNATLFDADSVDQHSYTLLLEKPDEWLGTNLRVPEFVVETTIEVTGQFRYDEESGGVIQDRLRVTGGEGTCLDGVKTSPERVSCLGGQIPICTEDPEATSAAEDSNLPCDAEDPILLACAQFLEYVEEVYVGECGQEAVPESFDGYCDSYEDVAGDCTGHFECLMSGYTCQDDGTVTVTIDGCPGCVE